MEFPRGGKVKSEEYPDPFDHGNRWVNLFPVVNSNIQVIIRPQLEIYTPEVNRPAESLGMFPIVPRQV